MFLSLKKIIFRKYYKELQDIENYMQQYFVHTLPNIKNKPSIAFCISGHIRDYTKIIKNYKIFKEYISNYGSVDVFLSTWNKQNSAHCWSTAHGLSADDSHTIDINEKEIIDNFETTNIEINDYDFFNSSYSPLRYSIFTKNEYNWDPRGIYGGVVNSTKMFYLIYKANLLKLKQEQLNNCTYDWVFRLRPDMFFNIDICQNTIKLDQLDNTKLYIPGSKNKGDDQFAFGGSFIMDRYASIIYRLSQAFDQNLFGDPESVMKKILFDFIESDIVYIPRCGSLAAERPHSLLPFR